MLRTILVSTLLTGALLAQPGPGPRPGAGGKRQAEALQQAIGLSETQMTQLRELRRTQNEAVKPQAQEMKAAAQALREALRAENPDGNAIVNAIRNVRALRAQMAEQRKAYEQKARAILSMDQLAKLDALERNRANAPVIRQATVLGLLPVPDRQERGQQLGPRRMRMRGIRG